MKIGDVIKFDYKRGPIRGVVTYVSSMTVVCKLLWSYQGRNVYWGIGESKAVNVKEMKNIIIENQ